MSNDTTATGGNGLRVAAYYRMSDDEQKLSIGQQQTEVRQLCALRGWVVVAEYIDSGKSGSKDVAKRTDFHRMIADAGKGNWSAIVCWDSSRFGRLDTIDAAQYKGELRKHGVYLETVKEGRIDWNTSMGRIQDAIMSEQNHKYSTDIASNAVRGRLAIMEMGYWAVGEVPFGYDRQFVEGGTVRMVIPRGEKFSKPRNWHTKLVINKEEASIVVKLFRRFASADQSARSFCKELNEDKVVGPGTIWTPQMLLRLLRDVSYIGKHRVGHARKNKEAHKRMQQTEKANVCPPIVDVDLFEAVQEKLAKRDKAKGNGSQVRSGALSGILVCGHCGYRLEKRQVGGAATYVCSSANRRQHLGCRQFTVRESDVMSIIATEVLAGVDMKKLQLLQSKPSEFEADVAKMEKNVADLTKKYDRASSNLLLCDPEIFPTMQAEVLAIKAERDKAANTLAAAQNRDTLGSVAAIKAWQEANADKLVRFAVPTLEAREPSAPLARHDRGYSGVRRIDKEYEADRLMFREALKGLGVTLTLHWSPAGKRYHALAFGTISGKIPVNQQKVLTADSNNSNRASSLGRG